VISKKTSVETDLTDTIKQHNLNCELIDTYREKNKELGFTWNRGDCYSRLDYIYVSIILKSRIVSSEVDWAFDKSDHAAVCTKVLDYSRRRLMGSRIMGSIG
jgi:exonuclease III